MRKIIETLSTLTLWAVFIVGSGMALFDFFYKTDASEMMMAHLRLISIAPLIAVIIFGSMLVAVRFSKDSKAKKTIPNEHAAQWSIEEYANAQTGKVVDLHFPSTGLACHVVTRDEVALVLYSETTTVHLKVVPKVADEPAAMALLSQSL